MMFGLLALPLGMSEMALFYAFMGLFTAYAVALGRGFAGREAITSVQPTGTGTHAARHQGV